MKQKFLWVLLASLGGLYACGGGGGTTAGSETPASGSVTGLSSTSSLTTVNTN